MIQSSVVTIGAAGYSRPRVSTSVRPSPTPDRRRRQARMVPVVVVGAVAFAGGAVLGAAHQRAVERFARAWERGDLAAMYGELSGDARARVDRRGFTRAYDTAMTTATVG